MNTLKEKIARGEKVIGMHVSLTDIVSARIVGLAGYDFVWVDAEHAPINAETLLGHIITIQAAGTAVVVRVPQDDLTFTKKVLDMGPDGIIFPMVKSAKEAQRLIGYTLYPPYGTRGFGPQNAINYGLDSPWEYVQAHQEKLCRFIQVEHIDAVNQMDDFMQNQDIDGYIFGPNDLSASIGELGNVKGENNVALIAAAVEKLHKGGKYVGISTGATDDETLTFWHNLGMDMLCAGMDYAFVRDCALKNRKNLERLHKGM